MSGQSSPSRWLLWAQEIQALSQTGLHYAENPYQQERYQRLMQIAAEISAAHSNLDEETFARSFFDQPGYATPKVDVRGAVMQGGNVLLVQERSDGKWCLPGGWADVGETPSQMVTREVREEAGLIVTPIRVIGVYDANRGGTPLAFYHAYKVVFLCEALGGSLAPSSETSDARYFEPDQIPALSVARTHPRHLRDLFARLVDPTLPPAFD